MLRPAATFAFLSREWRFLSFGLLVAFWSSPGQTFLISLFSAEFRQEFGLSHGGFGSIYTAATLLSAAILLKAGPLIDRMRLRTFVWWVAVLMVVATAGMSLVSGPFTLLVGILCVRFMGQGMMGHVAITAMARRFERERGRAIAIAGLGFPFGEAVFPPIVIVALGWMEWRGIWLFLAAAAALCLLPLIPLLLRRTAGQDGAGPDALAAASVGRRHWTRGEMLRDFRFYLIAPAPMAHSAIGTGIFFHQVHLVQTKGWSLEWWGVCFAIFAVCHVVGSLATGWLVDQVRARRVMPFVLVPLALALVALAGLDDAIWAALILGLMGIGAGAVQPATSALWPEIYGTRHLGAIRSVAAVLGVFASALGPVAMGWALDWEITIAAIALTSAAITVAAGALATIGARAT